MMDDDDPHKLHRTGGPHTSEAAAHDVDTEYWRRQVLETIRSFGSGPDEGCIQDQVLARFPWAPYSSVTARFDGLEEDDLIVRGPDTRPGKSGSQQLVMRAVLNPQPESVWAVRVRVKLADGQIFILEVVVNAKNIKTAHKRARRKAAELMVLEIKNISEPFAGFTEED